MMKTIIPKCICIGTLCLSPLTSAVSSEKNDAFELSISASTVLNGDLNIDGEALFNTELKYFFKSPYFASAGVGTDSDKQGSAIDIVYFEVGREFILRQHWKRQPYLSLALGAASINEDISINLINQSHHHSYRDTELKAFAALGLNLTKTVRTQFLINQIGNSTTLGLGFSMSF